MNVVSLNSVFVPAECMQIYAVIELGDGTDGYDTIR